MIVHLREYMQRGGSYSIVPRVPGGELTPRTAYPNGWV